jgi:hypothetical protein
VESRSRDLRQSFDSALDWAFFVFGGAAAVWLAALVFWESFDLGWWQIVVTAVFWVLLAYLVLPRLHRILTRIYVPEYFIGRARTSDGLLGDPVNVALLGTESQVHEVMSRAGWTMADDLSLATGWRIVTSTLLRRSYLEAPVSPLLLFARKQDFAYQQEVDGSPGKRHHVRFWRSPAGWKLPGGRDAEWLAAGTYDRSVGLSLFTLQVTHKIDANTDAERDHVVASIGAANPAVAVDVIEDFSTGYHARNGGGDAIATDGNLPVVDLRAVRGPITELRDITTDSRDRRPAPTAIGAAFVFVRGLLALYLAISLLASPDSFAADLAVVPAGAERTVAFWAVAAVLVVFAAAELGLAWAVLLGRNWARLTAMTLSTAAILAQAANVVQGGPGITLQTNLPGLAVDILLLLALSSERALVYARRERKAPKRIAARPGAVARL